MATFMLKNKIYLRLLALLGGTLIAACTAAAQADSNSALLNILVRKGIITKDEAVQIQKEAAAAPAPAPAAAAPAAPVPVEKTKANSLAFRIGNADFTPLGFVDFTTVYRSTNVGSGIGTNFAGIPYSNTSAGQLSETRFSAQNSRIGLRIDSNVENTKVLGYLETDFLGNAANSLNISSNAATMRMRVYFADLKWGNWEVLAGQDWSMLTPNRKGLSPIPGDIFFTNNMDTNYQAGLVWARQPQIRLVNHVTDEFTAGISLENPEQYAGGGNGLSPITFPTGFNTAQVNTGAATSTPNQMPDLIGKLAYDTKVNGLAWHFDVAGLYRAFKVNTFVSGATPVNANSSANGTGGSFNANLELVKDFRVIGNAFWSKGGGRYIFGQAPDFIVNPPDASGAYTISPLSAQSYLVGLEWQATPATLFSGYYSTVKIGQKTAQQSNGTWVGYGYTGSPTSNNKSIDEYTLAATQTIWKNPAYGALQVIFQGSYLDRKPWYVAPGTPTDAHTSMFFVNMRYVLP